MKLWCSVNPSPKLKWLRSCLRDIHLKVPDQVLMWATWKSHSQQQSPSKPNHTLRLASYLLDMCLEPKRGRPLQSSRGGFNKQGNLPARLVFGIVKISAPSARILSLYRDLSLVTCIVQRVQRPRCSLKAASFKWLWLWQCQVQWTFWEQYSYSSLVNL